MALLQVVVAQHCPFCRDAEELARRARTWFPDLHIEILDLEADGAVKPDAVAAVPTYLLDGRVLALGNPRAEDLRRRLSRRLTARRRGGGAHAAYDPRDRS